MADPCFLTDCKIWNGGYDLTGSINSVSLTASNPELADSRFGDLLEAKYPGRVNPMLSAKGFASFSTLANLEPDAVLFSRVNGSDVTSWPASICPPSAPPGTAAGADGSLAYTITGAEFEYALSGEHGQLMPYTFKKLPRSGGRLIRGTIVLPKALVSATTTGTGRNLGAITANQIMVAVLHVFAINGGSWVLTVESDDNSGFTTPVTRGTFTAVTTAPNRLVVEIAGAITDNWWRVILTKTGGTSITPSAVLGIVPTP